MTRTPDQDVLETSETGQANPGSISLPQLDDPHSNTENRAPRSRDPCPGQDPPCVGNPGLGRHLRKLTRMECPRLLSANAFFWTYILEGALSLGEPSHILGTHEREGVPPL